MTLLLRMAAPIAASISAILAAPINSVWSLEAETQLASNDRGSRSAARTDAPSIRTKPMTTPAVPAAPVSREAFVESVWAQVSADMVNARSGPGTQFAIVSTLRGGDYVRAVARIGGWIEMQWPAAAPAWVSQDFVKPDGSVTGSNVRLRSGGNLNASILAEAGKGDKLEILGSAGGWYKVKAPESAKAYIFARYVILGVKPPDGPAAPVVPDPEPKAPAQPVAEVTPEIAPAHMLASQPTEMPATVSTQASVKIPAPNVPETASIAVPPPEIQIPKLELTARASVGIPDSAEAMKPVPNNLPILELLAQETKNVPVVPPIVMEILPQEMPAVETPPELAALPAPSVTNPPLAPEAPTQTASTPPPPEIPLPQPEPKTVRPFQVEPPEEVLWGDELPPPKRVKILPGPRGDPALESSLAPLPAPALREGGLVTGLIANVSEKPDSAVTAVRAEVVDVLPTDPRPEPKQIVRPRIMHTPILPTPTGAAPLAIRLPVKRHAQTGPMDTDRIQEAEGRLDAYFSSTLNGSGCALNADDGRVWILIDTCGCRLESFLGARVRVVGTASYHPLAAGESILCIKQITVIP